MPMITLTLVADATPALINTDWIAYAFEQEPSRITLLKLGSPHMETLHVKEPLAEIREIIKRGASGDLPETIPV